MQRPLQRLARNDSDMTRRTRLPHLGPRTSAKLVSENRLSMSGGPMRECYLTDFAAGRMLQTFSPSVETAHIEALTAMTSRASRIGGSSADSSAVLLWRYMWQCLSKNIGREDPKLTCTWKGVYTALTCTHVRILRVV